MSARGENDSNSIENYEYYELRRKLEIVEGLRSFRM